MPLHENFYFDQDHHFCTSHDYKVACILSNDLLQVYLNDMISKLTLDASAAMPHIVWTGSKVWLVELIYALHAHGVFNDGEAMLKDITKIFETSFHMDLGHTPRLFHELRARKSGRTLFLDGLAAKLISRMNEADRY